MAVRPRGHARPSRELRWPLSVTGEWANGTPDGRGVETTRGGMYTGEMRDGVRRGEGTFRKVEGEKYISRYDGQWRDGREHGRAMVVDAEGGCFVGTYKDGCKEGRGTYTAADGTVFLGYYVEGRREGVGVTISPNGERLEARYRGDRLSVPPARFELAIS